MQGIQYYLIVAILVLGFSPLPLVSLDPETSIDRYLMDEWKIPDGLPADTIRAITQTPDGFLSKKTGTGRKGREMEKEIEHQVYFLEMSEIFREKDNLLVAGRVPCDVKSVLLLMPVF
jgi:hypothetical protein